MHVNGSQQNVAKLRNLLLALVMQASLVAVFTWPLPGHMATHFAKSLHPYDSMLVGWALAHQSESILHSPGSFADAGIYHPEPGSLFYGEAGFGAVPYFAAPFWLTGNPTLALNWTLLAGLTLTATALHLVTLWWSGSHLAGWIAGATFLATPWVRWNWIPIAANYAVLPYFPLIVLLASAPAMRVRRACGLGLLVVVQGLTSVYVAGAVLGPLVLLGGLRTLRRSTRRGGLALLLVSTISTLLLLGAYSGYAWVRAQNPRILEQTPWPRPAIPTTELATLFFDPARPTGAAGGTLALVALGTLSLLFGGVRELGESARRGWLHAGFWFVAGTFFSLRPAVELLGWPLPTPQALAARWTSLFDVVRDVHRLGIASTIGAALLGGLAFAECARRVHRLSAVHARALVPVLAVAVVVGLWVQTGHGRLLGYPTVAAPGPPPGPILEALRSSRGPLLELPIEGGPRAYTQHAEAMYRSIFHQRPLLNGYHGYWPARFPERMRLARALPDPDALRVLVHETGVETILVDSADYGRWQPRECVSSRRPPPRCRSLKRAAERERRVWLALADAGGGAGLELVARAGDELLFVVSPRPVAHVGAP